MSIHLQHSATLTSKQATLLVEGGPVQWHVCRFSLKQFVHEGMNDISNVKVHLKARTGNVNIYPISCNLFCG